MLVNTFKQFLEKNNRIQDAVEKPGSLTKTAKKKKKSIAGYCENPPSGKAEKRCNLWRTLKSINK